jgi:hypothetical protein
MTAVGRGIARLRWGVVDFRVIVRCKLFQCLEKILAGLEGEMSAMLLI